MLCGCQRHPGARAGKLPGQPHRLGWTPWSSTWAPTISSIAPTDAEIFDDSIPHDFIIEISQAEWEGITQDMLDYAEEFPSTSFAPVTVVSIGLTTTARLTPSTVAAPSERCFPGPKALNLKWSRYKVSSPQGL